MKKMIAIYFFMLMMVLVSCKSNSSDTENTPIPTSDHYEQIEKTYMELAKKEKIKNEIHYFK